MPTEQKKIHISLPVALKQKAIQAAEDDHRSLNSWVVLAIKEKLARAKIK